MEQNILSSVEMKSNLFQFQYQATFESESLFRILYVYVECDSFLWIDNDFDVHSVVSYVLTST